MKKIVLFVFAMAVLVTSATTLVNGTASQFPPQPLKEPVATQFPPQPIAPYDDSTDV